MEFRLSDLPYALDALAPLISRETLEVHYGRHHKAYVDRLNALVPGSRHERQSLEEIILSKPGATLFNNAAQAWNHAFYWNCLAPKAGGDPRGAMGAAIREAFGGFADFKARFTDGAVSLFGSGWAWLVKRKDGSLAISQTRDADCPMTAGDTALMTCDVWEHAYYIDYRNARSKYVEAFWNLVNWEFVEKNLRG